MTESEQFDNQPVIKLEVMNNILTLRHRKCDWVSDCCLMPNEQIFNYIIARPNYILMR